MDKLDEWSRKNLRRSNIRQFKPRQEFFKREEILFSDGERNWTFKIINHTQKTTIKKVV